MVGVEDQDGGRDGGEMGQLLRGMDWSQTPLGPIDAWSQSLRTTVRVLLANRFPQLLWWGPEYISIYNDAYRPILGAKHPWALGKPVRECWSEIWYILQPLIETPYKGGPATWDDDLSLEVNRHGFVEETHFTVAYSPVPDESVQGGIGGVLATVHETTRQVLQERRMVVLRDLGAASADAKTAITACQIAADVFGRHPKDVPFAVLYLIDPGRSVARLAAAAGVREGDAAAPVEVDLANDGQSMGAWPFSEALRAEEPQVVEDLHKRFPAVPPGPWSDPPNRAIVLPIASNIAHNWLGLIVLGLSPRVQFDDSYRGFCELATAQVATAIAHGRAYEEERRRAELLAELDREKTAFFSNVSHEFRTPLTLLLGPVEDLIAGARGQLLPEQQVELEVAHRNALRLLRLVNMLLDFSRIEANRVEAAYEVTDVAALTAELASTFRSAIERAGLVLEIDCPPLPADVSVYVDPDMWEKIVLNLLSNALKFTIVGEIGVSMRASSDGRSVELRVRDTGTGIPADELPRLFERFHRVAGARARTHEGTGIGLALVQELVRLHGGSVEVESAVDVGSTFTVSIPAGHAHLPADRLGVGRTVVSTATGASPYVEEALRWLPSPVDGTFVAAQADHLLSTPTGSDAHLPLATGSARVLLVDDNADMREYVARLLRTRYEVEAAADGETALSIALNRPPDLVLADVMMPGLGGFELVRALRQAPSTREMPIILLSARAGEEARVEGMETGADDYLIKPFAARELLARVGAHLELGRFRAMAAAHERAARAEADEARQQLHDLFMQAPAMICVLRGPEHVFELVNPRFLYAAGHRQPDELIGKRLCDVFPELDAQGQIALIDRVYQTGEAYVGYELPLRFDPRGNERREDCFYNFVYQPSRDAGGIVDGILIHAVDVTQQVQTREELRRQAHLLDLTHDAIFVWEFNGPGQSGPITFWNPACTDLYGYSAEEALGRVSHELLRTRHPFGSYAAFESALESAGEWQGDVVHTARDGRELIVASRHLLVSETDGRRWVLESSQDVTDLRAAEVERERVERDKDEFLATASHDLKNPLATIKTSAQMIQRQLRGGALDAERLAGMAARIDAGATNMAGQIEALLDLTRMRLGRALELELAPTDLVALARRVIAEQQGTSERHTIVLSATREEIVGIWDVRRLERALANLVSNAIKYSPDGGRVEVTLTCEEVADGVHAVVSVSDHGVGIPSEDLPRIFEQFERASNVTGSIPGTGLGLAGVQRIVEQHGGTISVATRLREGSTFVMRLPLSPA